MVSTRAPRIMAILALALSLPACSPASLGIAVASLALDAVAGGESTPLTPGESLNRSLAGLDNRLSKACLDALPPDAPQLAPVADPESPAPNRSASGRSDPVNPAPPGSADGVIALEAASSNPGAGDCRVAPVCLPGKSVPAEMMVCPTEGDPTKTQTVTRGSRMPTQDDWKWLDPVSDGAPPARISTATN
jgi:hypothetical protein